MQLVTREDMVEYIRARLGHPVLDLELELDSKNGFGHAHMAIQDSLDFMFRHAQDEADYMDWMVIKLDKGIIEYKLPEYVTDVIDINPTWGNGFTPWTSFDVGPGESLVATTGWSQFDLVTYVAGMAYLADVKKIVGVSYTIHFSPNERKLRVYPHPKEDRYVMVQIYRKAKISEVFNMINFRDLAVARTRYIWGTILAKDDVAMPGGGKINGSIILATAEKELEKIENAIKSESAPCFFIVA